MTTALGADHECQWCSWQCLAPVTYIPALDLFLCEEHRVLVERADAHIPGPRR